VQSQFDWQRFLAAGQVRAVLNYVATADWVVAIFPRFFQILRLQDLGSAGHDGFKHEPSSFVTDVEYVAGTHSAALDERHWQDIANFVIDQRLPPIPAVHIRSTWVVAAGYLTPILWTALVILAASPFYLFLTALDFPEVTGLLSMQAWQTRVATRVPAWVWAFGLIAWMRTLTFLLTRL
jgi:hypothetical protein